jgi:hypothetical protein
MIIKLDIDKGIVITAETQFESDYIGQTFGSQKLLAFVKRGLTPKDVIGLKICLPGKEPGKESIDD